MDPAPFAVALKLTAVPEQILVLGVVMVTEADVARLTVTKTESIAEQDPLDTVRKYLVVANGVAIGLAILGLFKLPAGAHE